jgi:3'(2'), 5'-bisphosphate nucleotidase
MNYSQLLQFAIHASIDAGKEILNVYNSPDFDVQIKKDKSPLTEADLRANDIITNYLSRTNIPILSEEGKEMKFGERKDWKQFWLVDPLDGTKEFIKRNGEFTVNIALVEEKKTTMGVIYVPVSEELYFSHPEKGSYKISLKNTTDLDVDIEALMQKAQHLPVKEEGRVFTVVASRSHMSEETEKYIHDLKEDHGEIDFMSKGSSLKICMVAEGKADVYPRFAPTMEWDTAAGHAIAKGAGFNVYKNTSDSELAYNKENLLNPFFVVK